MQPIGNSEAEFDEPLSLPCLRPRAIDLENPQFRGNLRPALRKSIQSCSENDVLLDAAAELFHDHVFDEPRPRENRGAEEAREARVHIRPASPVVARGGKREANLIFEHVRRRIDLNVQGPPQSHPYRCAVWSCGFLVSHRQPVYWFTVRVNVVVADLLEAVLVPVRVRV